MSEKSGRSRDADRKKTTIPRKTLIIIGIVIVIAIAAVTGYVLLTNGTTTQGSSDPFMKAGALYTQSVDLANTGKYQEALDKADAALAENVSSLIPLIQSNRAGILVMLGRNNEAISAADVAISAQGNLTGLRSVAWYNKANALSNLGRNAEADAAYANASALNQSLKHP